MTAVWLGLGSNIHPEDNLRAGLERLQQGYRVVQVSPWYRSPAMGFEGPDFINLAVQIEYPGTPQALAAELKALEADFGRAPDAVKYSSRALDVDILLFGELAGDFSGVQIPRPDIRECAYVLRPLLDILPHGVDPHSGEPLQAYWPALAAQPLYPIGH